MTEIDWSWLYGDGSPAECPYCDEWVYPVASSVVSHSFWCEKRPGSWLHPYHGIQGLRP